MSAAFPVQLSILDNLGTLVFWHQVSLLLFIEPILPIHNRTTEKVALLILFRYSKSKATYLPRRPKPRATLNTFSIKVISHALLTPLPSKF